jgi:DNA-binding protein YbaB
MNNSEIKIKTLIEKLIDSVYKNSKLKSNKPEVELVQDISDENHLVRLQIDGHFKIVQLSIDKSLSIEEIERIMPDLFSRAIDSIAEKIRLKLEDLQAAHN